MWKYNLDKKKKVFFYKLIFFREIVDSVFIKDVGFVVIII